MQKDLATKAMGTSNLSGDELRSTRMKKKNSKTIIRSPPVFQNNGKFIKSNKILFLKINLYFIDSSVDNDDYDKDKSYIPANINHNNQEGIQCSIVIVFSFSYWGYYI